MQAFLTRNYRWCFLLLLLSVIGLSFYAGTLQATHASAGVTLSCTDEVLATLAIPSGGPEAGKLVRPSTDSLAASATPQDTPQDETPTATPEGAFAGSKNGTKYYTPGCSGLKRIKPENIIWFVSKEDAELQGYTAAKC